MKKVFAVLFTILAVVGIAQIGGDRKRLSEQGPAQMNAQALCDCPFIPLAGTEVGSPVTGDIEIADTNNDPRRIYSEFNGGSNLMQITFYENAAIEVRTDNTTTGAFSRTYAAPGEATLDAHDGTESTAFSVQEGAALMHSGLSTFKGIEYVVDWSANFTDGSLVDKRYVDNSNAILEGSGAPSIIPTRKGQEYFDTTNEKWYKAKNTTSTSDWIILN
jgi:hypothetical protein